MFDVFIRSLKRIALFVPGIIIAALVSYELYPALDNKLPAIVAALIVYILIAYVILPFMLRVFRFFKRPKHLPVYSTTADGFASDPVNIAILGTKEQLLAAFTKAGWFVADRRTPKTIFKFIRTYLLGLPYPQAPFSKLYLFGRSQDIGFQLPLSDSTSHRHHVRFWEVAPKLSNIERLHLDFWRKHHPGFKAPPPLWLGAASLDNGTGLDRHNFQLNHMVHPDTNKERDLIVKQLKKTGVVASAEKITINNPYRLRNRVINASFQADGRLTIVELKS